MSKKFNFNTYFKEAKAKKTDDSYPKMLQEQHKDAPNALTEKQLAKKDHTKKPLNSTTEKQLAKVRVDEECLSTEGRLNKNKARFDIKHRNKEAFTGNINKIEAQRIGKDKMEDEKYEAASVVPKGMRWWEKEAKIAKLKAELQKLSAKDDLDSYLQDESRGWEGVAEMGDTPETGVIDSDPANEFVGKPQLDTEEEDVDAVGSRNLFVTDKQEKEVAGIYTLMFKVCYDPTGWDGDMDALKQEALDKVVLARPDLEGKVSVDDISDRPSTSKDGQPCMVFRVVGDEYRPTSGGSSAENFKELAYKQDEMDGTPVVKGVYKINNLSAFMGRDGADIDEMAVAKAVADFVDEKHPELGIEAESIVVDLDRKVATFVVEATSGETTPEEFPITEEGAIDSMLEPSVDFPVDDEFDDRFK